MTGPDQKKLIKKLFDGNCTEEELDILFAMVSTLPEQRASEVMAALWQQATAYPRLQRELSQKMYAGILSRIGQADSPAVSPTTPLRKLQRPRKRALRLVGMAAALLLALGLITWLWLDQGWQTISTDFAERREVLLPDGTRAILNAHSSLRYKKNWDAVEDREVQLEGEAFFEVTKKPVTGQKFRVHTPDLTVEVLGTVFNVNSRQTQTSVFLEEGKIALTLHQTPQEPRMMVPGELITYSSEKAAIVVDSKAIDPVLHTSWKDGVLTFEDAPLTDILQKVEELYGIRFRIDQAIDLDREITTGLPMEELEVVIPMLEQVLGRPILQEGNGYLIK